MAIDDYLTADQLYRALTLRDLTDPAQGEHAIQTLLATVVDALKSTWQNTVRWVRTPPIVAVAENYDRLGYDRADVTRARRYSRYVSPTAMLRSHTSANIPTALEDYAGRTGIDELSSSSPGWCTVATSSTEAMSVSPTKSTCGASATHRTPATTTCSP